MRIKPTNFFTWAYTPMGSAVPPLISARLLALMGTSPLVSLTSVRVNHGGLVMVTYLMILAITVWDCLQRRRAFWEGMTSGRCELTEEMRIAWLERGMHPSEYLMMESWVIEQNEDAMTDAVRAATRDHPPST